MCITTLMKLFFLAAFYNYSDSINTILFPIFALAKVLPALMNH